LGIEIEANLVQLFSQIDLLNRHCFPGSEQIQTSVKRGEPPPDGSPSLLASPMPNSQELPTCASRCRFWRYATKIERS
jgi:hypothetical protein